MRKNSAPSPSAISSRTDANDPAGANLVWFRAKTVALDAWAESSEAGIKAVPCLWRLEEDAACSTVILEVEATEDMARHVFRESIGRK